jgi:hypothetical protein
MVIKMIMTASGGIGNQLFCLAAALCISEKRNKKIVIYSDNCEFVRHVNTRQESAASSIKVQIKFAKKNNFWINKLCGWIAVRSTRSRLLSFFFNKIVQVQESPWQFPFELLQISNELPQFLLGYFQSAKLIESLNEDIVNFLVSIIDSSNPVENSIDNGGVRQVGVHIRRGDYLSIPEYGVLATKYFLEILSHFNTSETKIKISSDDKAVLEEFAKYGDVTTLSPDSIDPMGTMSYLAQSEVFIMSNSTFSFWIAWAVSIRGGLVYAPQPWFQDTVTPEDYLYLRGFIHKPSVFENGYERS